MVKKLMLAVAMVALLAAPSFAAVQNVKVGGDLKTTSVIRNSFDLGSNTADGSGIAQNRTQNVVLSQINLNVDADLTDNVSTKIGLKNERIWGTDANASSGQTVKLETGYVTMKELFYAPLTVSVGRQPLSYGNELVIGKGGRNNPVAEVEDLTGDANFDAIKAVLAYDALTVDLFASKVDENKLTSDGVNTNVNLYGVNANYKVGDKMSTVVEAYVFAKRTGVASSAAGGNTKGDLVYVPGLRVSTNPIEGLNVQLEGAYQTGTIGHNASADVKETLRAYALQGMVNYALPVMKDMKPVLSGGLTYLSGDDDDPSGTSSNKNNQWQTMYGNQFVGTIWNTLFSQKNLVIGSVAVEAVPLKDLTAKLTWYSVSLAQRVSSLTLNRPDSTSPEAALSGLNTSKNKSLGNEIDLDLTYAYTEDVKFGVSAGYFLPGKGLSPQSKDSATQLLSSVSVSF